MLGLGSLSTLLLLISVAAAWTTSNQNFVNSHWDHESEASRQSQDVTTLDQNPAGLGPHTETTLTNHVSDVFDQLQEALKVMESQFYAIWIGTWPTAIDWTAAVINTHVSSGLSTFASYAGAQSVLSGSITLTEVENNINRYFAQNVAFYFGENAFALRNEAFDDILWVVLGWLESTRFIQQYDKVQYTRTWQPWHGTQFIPAFAHRARIFYDLATHGWDTRLCGGGMTWNPRLEPYKNAITNQLFISASVSMYLYFPGDYNSSPYLVEGTGYEGLEPALPHNPEYLKAAIDGYAWLQASNMTNTQGLYVDGFHIKDWTRHNQTGTGKCDARNEMVYTYNQGVLLSGLRGLWEATGNTSYLSDGHELIRNVMAATGWDGSDNTKSTNSTPQWAGLGRAGILEEYCDHSGNCSQDGQTFKGIFFLHLTQFCKTLPQKPMLPGKTYAADKNLAFLHRSSCKRYGEWVNHNARAAMTTRDAEGRYGSWWGHEVVDAASDVVLPDGAVDYRNDPAILDSASWSGLRDSRDLPLEGTTKPLLKDLREVWSSRGPEDVNSRGRGRTVETQGGGLAVLRAAWEFGRI